MFDTKVIYRCYNCGKFFSEFILIHNLKCPSCGYEMNTSDEEQES